MELADQGVLVNAVSPAAVDTENALASDPKMRAPLLAKIPMGRAAKPEEIAALVAFLASPACAFSTGANFDITGGPRQHRVRSAVKYRRRDRARSLQLWGARA